VKDQTRKLNWLDGGEKGKKQMAMEALAGMWQHSEGLVHSKRLEYRSIM